MRAVRVYGWTAPVSEGRIEIGPFAPIDLAASQVCVVACEAAWKGMSACCAASLLPRLSAAGAQSP